MAAERNDSLAAAVAALAGEVENVRRALEHKAPASELERLAAVVTNLADAVNTARPGNDPEPVLSWLTLPGSTAAESARGLLADLTEWMATVYLRYADAAGSLPECWLWHPDIVEELLVLMSAWLAAFTDDDASVRAAGDWHDRLRPGVVRRIGEYAKACSLDNHLADGRAANPAPTVPVVDAAEAIALWWADARDERAPAPTEDQLAVAATAMRRARTGGGR